MSSASKYGYAFRMSAMECPDANSPTTVPTVTRKPRIHGFPPITSGSRVIRVNCFMVHRKDAEGAKKNLKQEKYGMKKRTRRQGLITTIPYPYLTTQEFQNEG